MNFSDEDIQEFKSEAEELLQDAEDHLLKMEHPGDYNSHYAAVFRAFHSLKGASGMLGLDIVKVHVHKLENFFTAYKAGPVLSRELVTFFLAGADATRSLLDGKSINFDYGQGETIEVQDNKLVQDTNKNDKPLPLIYVVDDEEDILEIIKHMIPSTLYQTVTFSSPEIALETCAKTPPDLVLTDMKMPKINGLEVLRKVKEIDSEIPVIYISAFIDKEVLITALNLGVFAVLEKPIKQNLVINFVTQAIRKKEMWKVLNKSIDLILFQLSDMEKYLISQGKIEEVKTMKEDARNLLEARRALKKIKDS